MSHDRFDHIQASITKQIALAKSDSMGRREALEKLESGGRRAMVYWSRMDRPLNRSDVLPVANLIKSIGKVPELDFVIVSPGGDGTTAETLLELCRKYCTHQLRVVVPAFAKSAATLIALGADEIVMGESSEIGPIDAQISVAQDGTEQWVSADHVIRARNRAIEALRAGDTAEQTAAQIQLSLLSPAFLQFCEDSMNFGRDFARKQLKSHMFCHEIAADAACWEPRIDAIIEGLISSARHLTHGRMITAQDIKNDSELQYLKVNELAADDAYWQALNELLLRTEFVAQENEFGKILFAQDFDMFGG